jgi:hypothetical protein
MRHLILRISTICLILIFLTSSIANAQQWTGPDASSNIYNANTSTGQVIVQSTNTSTLPLFVVNPNGLGIMAIGNPNTGSGGYTSLTLGISAAQTGYSTIQSIKSAGSAFGILCLNAKGGNVLIGKTSQTNTAYLLDVNGNARMNQVVVNTTGADYVFDPGYCLIPLKELDLYLRQQHHLPGIAPASQMQKEGLDLGDNQTRLLARVEELTLYLIDKDKEISALKDQMAQMEKRDSTLQSLQQRLQNLELRFQKLAQSDQQASHQP